MKEYCVDFEIAKQLKKLRFKQDSLFYWIDLNFQGVIGKEIKPYPIYAVGGLKESDLYYPPICSAFISDEILNKLPKKLFGCHLEIDRTDMSYYVWYIPIGTDIDQRPKDFVSGNTDKKLSNVLAEKWIYLKKKGYIK